VNELQMTMLQKIRSDALSNHVLLHTRVIVLQEDGKPKFYVLNVEDFKAVSWALGSINQLAREIIEEDIKL
jgi:hypothetical protein